MTNERAKSELMQIYMSLSEEKKKALDIAIKALEQEPSDVFDEYGNYKYPSDVELTEPNTVTSMPSGDAVSRQAVLDMWRQEICYGRTCHARDEGRCTETFCDFKLFEYKINHMPSVTPQKPKTGHWKRISMDKYTTHAQYWYRCDRCGKDTLGNTDWCPSCGARMIKPQNIVKRKAGTPREDYEPIYNCENWIP